MSMALDSPMEALAIDYLTHTVLNVWAWLAFLTAALSFWKIKSSVQSPLHHRLPSPPPSPPQPPQTSDDQPDPDQQDELPSTTNPTPLLFTSSTTFCTLEKTRSGKFSVYYGEDDSIAIGRSERRMMGSVRCNYLEEDKRSIRQVDGWEALLKLKTADMGWYRYQDLTVLDGSVVQLWNRVLVKGGTN